VDGEGAGRGCQPIFFGRSVVGVEGERNGRVAVKAFMVNGDRVLIFEDCAGTRDKFGVGELKKFWAGKIGPNSCKELESLGAGVKVESARDRCGGRS